MAIISGTKKTEGREFWTSDSLHVNPTKPDTPTRGRWVRLGNVAGFVLVTPVAGTTTGFGSSNVPTPNLSTGECIADFEVGHVYKCTVWGTSSAAGPGTQLHVVDADINNSTQAGELTTNSSATGAVKVNLILLDSITGASAHDGTRVMIAAVPPS